MEFSLLISTSNAWIFQASSRARNKLQRAIEQGEQVHTSHGCGQTQCYSWVENGETGWSPSSQHTVASIHFQSRSHTSQKKAVIFQKHTTLSQLQQTRAVLHPVQLSHPQVLCVSTYALADAAVKPGCFFINYISSLAKIIWRWPQQTSFLRKSRVCASQR